MKTTKTARPIGVKLREDHAMILSEHCKRHRVPVAAFIREAALEVVKGGLGLGVEAVYGTTPQHSDPRGVVASVLPIKLTEKQRAAIIAHCIRHSITPSAFMREAALRRTGRVDPFASTKK